MPNTVAERFERSRSVRQRRAGQTDWPVYGHDPGGLRYSPLTRSRRTMSRGWSVHGYSTAAKTTGKPAPGFRDEGLVDMRKGVLGDLPDARMAMQSPPGVYTDIVITGSNNNEPAPRASVLTATFADGMRAPEKWS